MFNQQHQESSVCWKTSNQEKFVELTVIRKTNFLVIFSVHLNLMKIGIKLKAVPTVEKEVNS